MENSSPSAYISSITRKPVLVKLNNGSDFTGTLASLDERMNLAMENTCEYLDGVLVKSYGDAFIRGNNGIFKLYINF
ncbi:U6 snRNA-associated Sm-lke protein, putative [Theileria annulata]|uniref:U6 snRNA-associated Sm-lke protein, putative n=1 Tax=Theileria annulata TaxID=5874 RepID=Q4UII3_THEAN|nr:U6 snRNA-associated Sm-lke protein, putative [Theileria annulata]CAI73106.1 U6 snRNA-associated Sm-lke protein, putative [Theileria annulata]|eukprot:XP_953784.1 U6 snRNA-associated Sm-lke protein, putative [Theileria annulata]